MLRTLLAFFGFLLLWLIVLMPLKLAVLMAGNQTALGYSDVFGSVWDGRVHNARLAGLDIQRLDVAVEPLGLLGGQVAAQVRASDPDLRGRGRISVAADGTLRAEQVDLVARLDALGLAGWPGLDPQARLNLEIDQLEWQDGRCRSAQGEVASAALIGFAEQFGYEGPFLQGVLSCLDDALAVTVSGESADLALDAQILLRSRDYSWTLRVDTQRADLADALALAGLERDGTDWRGEGQDTYGH